MREWYVSSPPGLLFGCDANGWVSADGPETIRVDGLDRATDSQWHFHCSPACACDKDLESVTGQRAGSWCSEQHALAGPNWRATSDCPCRGGRFDGVTREEFP